MDYSCMHFQSSHDLLCSHFYCNTQSLLYSYSIYGIASHAFRCKCRQYRINKRNLSFHLYWHVFNEAHLTEKEKKKYKRFAGNIQTLWSFSLTCVWVDKDVGERLQLICSLLSSGWTLTDNNCHSLSAPPPFAWLAHGSRCDTNHLMRYSHYFLV